MRQPMTEEITLALRGKYTSGGIVRWWNRPREELDGWTPTEYLDSIERKYQKLLDLARGGEAT